jgi:hypothetical protein
MREPEKNTRQLTVGRKEKISAGNKRCKKVYINRPTECFGTPLHINLGIMKQFGQEWPLISVSHAEITIAVRGKIERRRFLCSTNSGSKQSTFTNPMNDRISAMGFFKEVSLNFWETVKAVIVSRL